MAASVAAASAFSVREAHAHHGFVHGIRADAGGVVERLGGRRVVFVVDRALRGEQPDVRTLGRELLRGLERRLRDLRIVVCERARDPDLRRHPRRIRRQRGLVHVGRVLRLPPQQEQVGLVGLDVGAWRLLDAKVRVVREQVLAAAAAARARR